MKDTYKKGSHEAKMLKQSIADNNKQHKRGSENYISSNKKAIARKMKRKETFDKNYGYNPGEEANSKRYLFDTKKGRYNLKK